MGLDFSALFRYPGFRKSQQAITELERASAPEFRSVLEQWRRSGFFSFGRKYSRNAWVDPESGRQVKRPKTPDVAVALRTTESFSISFGRGVIYLYHLLRWHTFLKDPRWRGVMLDACASLARLMDASDCILAHDCHAVMGAFRRNLTFEGCLASVPPDEGEVASIDDLYVEIEDHESDVVMKPNGRLVRRDRSMPLPPGWLYPTVWDSKGYWRFKWSDD